MKKVLLRIFPLILILSLTIVRLPVYAAAEDTDASDETLSEEEDFFTYTEEQIQLIDRFGSAASALSPFRWT